jgi:hypothetical protein
MKGNNLGDPSKWLLALRFLYEVIYGDNNRVSRAGPLHKKSSEVEPAGAPREGDSLRPATKEVGLTERFERKVRGQGILFLNSDEI